jgi:hypothetical protein
MGKDSKEETTKSTGMCSRMWREPGSRHEKK